MDFRYILGPPTTEDKKPEPSEKPSVKTDQPAQPNQSRHNSFSSRSVASSPAQPSSRRQTVSSLLNDDDFDYSSRREKKNSISSILDNTPNSTLASTSPTDRHIHPSTSSIFSTPPPALTAYGDQTNYRDQSLNSVISQSVRQHSITSNTSVTNSPTMSNMLATESQHSPLSRGPILQPEGVLANNVLSILNHEASSSPPPVRLESKQTTPKRATPPLIANIICSAPSAISSMNCENDVVRTSNSSSSSSSILGQPRDGYASQNVPGSNLSSPNVNKNIFQTFPTPENLKKDQPRRSSISLNPLQSPVFKNPIYQSSINDSNMSTMTSDSNDAQKIHAMPDVQTQNNLGSKAESFHSVQPKLQPSLLQKLSAEPSHIAPKIESNLLNESTGPITKPQVNQHTVSQSDAILNSESNKIEPIVMATTNMKKEIHTPLKSCSEVKSISLKKADAVQLEDAPEAVSKQNLVLQEKIQLEATQVKSKIEDSNRSSIDNKIEQHSNNNQVKDLNNVRQPSIGTVEKPSAGKLENKLENSTSEKSDIISKNVDNSKVESELKVEPRKCQNKDKIKEEPKSFSNFESNNSDNSKVVSSPENSNSYETDSSVTEEKITDNRPISNAYDVYNNPIPIWAQNYRTTHNQKPVVTIAPNGKRYNETDFMSGRKPGYSSSVVDLPSSLTGTIPFNDLTRKIATWLYATLLNLEDKKKHVEVEIKLGKICSKKNGKRLELPIVTDTIIDFEYAKTQTVFKSGLSDDEFIRAKGIFDFLADKSKRNASSPSAIISFPERETTEIVMAKGDSSENLRITYNEENKETERVFKQKIDQLLIHSPCCDHDFRITVSVEIPDKMTVTNPNTYISKTKLSMRRSSYIHKALQVDLTRITTDDTLVTHELEFEINQSLLLQYFNGTQDNVRTDSLNFEELIEFTVDNTQLVIKRLAN